MSRPSIGVVIPARNAADTIADAVKSARAGRAPADHVLVVDDGSTDDTADRAADAGAEVIRHGRSHGAAAARDTGARRVGTDVVAFLDADDRMAEGWPGVAGDAFSRAPEAALLVGRAVELRDDGTLRVPPAWSPGDARQPLWALAWHNRVPTSAAVVPAWAYRASGGFDSDMGTAAEDFHLWLRLAQLGPFVCSAAIGAVRRVSDRSWSRRPAALDAMKHHGLAAVRRVAPDVADRAPWFPRVAAAHILREAARRSLAAGLDTRALNEARGAIRANPADWEAWLVAAAAALPAPLREDLRTAWVSVLDERARRHAPPG